MRADSSIAVVIPALDEERAIAKVIAEIPPWVDRIVVADNGSSDGTVGVAQAAGARVVIEPEAGYGAACLRGIAEAGSADIIVFLDGDYSDFPGEMHRLVDPIVDGTADLVIGSRTLGHAAPGSLTLPQRFGNRLACFFLRKLWGVDFTDLGPFRAIRRTSLEALGMVDKAFGWTVEMQIKAARQGLSCCEVPVDYRPRIGTSKVSGSVRGTVLAGTTILGWIARSALRAGGAGGRGGRGSPGDQGTASGATRRQKESPRPPAG